MSTGRAALHESGGAYALAEPLYQRSAQEFSIKRFVVEEAFALLAQGRCLTALERIEEADPPLRRAREMFANMGASALVGEVDELLGPTSAS